MQKQPLTLKQWAEVAFANARAKGLYSPNPEATIKEGVEVYLLNLHAEVSEAWEAHRDGRLFAHSIKVPAMSCIAEELADIVLRVFGTAEALGIDIEKAIAAKHEYNMSRPVRHGGKLA